MEYADTELVSQLKELRLHYTAENLDLFNSSLSGRTPREILSHIVSVELLEAQNRSIMRRMREARIGRYKRMEDFNWSHPEQINRAKIESLLSNDFTKLDKNLIIIGTQGLGKTMIARNLAAQAVYNGGRRGSEPHMRPVSMVQNWATVVNTRIRLAHRLRRFQLRCCRRLLAELRADSNSGHGRAILPTSPSKRDSISAPISSSLEERRMMPV
jgi:hypothetical protein